MPSQSPRRALAATRCGIWIRHMSTVRWHNSLACSGTSSPVIRRSPTGTTRNTASPHTLRATLTLRVSAVIGPPPGIESRVMNFEKPTFDVVTSDSDERTLTTVAHPDIPPSATRTGPHRIVSVGTTLVPCWTRPGPACATCVMPSAGQANSQSGSSDTTGESPFMPRWMKNPSKRRSQVPSHH